jgi:hypothetical protein
MSVFNDIGNFFTKEIPKFFTQTIPSAFEPETYAPDLIPLRKSVADLKVSVEKDRERFYKEQAALTAAVSRYRQLTDDFETNVGVTPEFDIDRTDRLTREIDEGEKTARDIAQASRTLTNIVSLGLAELGHVHADIAEERRVLNRQKTILTGTSRRFKNAIATLVSARLAVEAQITAVEQLMSGAGIEAGPSAASELTAAEAEQSARRDMAARLLGLGVDTDTITGLTGLTEAEIASIEAASPDRDDDPGDASALLTEEEQQLLSEKD